MHNYKELKVWQKSIDLTVKVYQISMQFPDSERFNLTSQSRRCSVSVPSNIAEGAGRNTNGEFAHFLGIASSSSYELEIIFQTARRRFSFGKYESLLHGRKSEQMVCARFVGCFRCAES